MTKTKRVKWTGVVKVQRELTTGYRDQTVFICSRDQSIVRLSKMSPELLERFGEDLKFYAHARLIDTIIHIGERVADQDW